MQEPSILTANTYFWNAAGTASARRRNEEKHINNVAEYLAENGFEIIDLNTSHVKAHKGKVEVVFYYSESAKNVYKSLTVYKEGKKSNITSLRKVIAAGTSLAGWKWRPSASQRKEFAMRMQDPVEKAEYEARKKAKADKRRATSKFDYEKAGGYYVPTEDQYKDAFYMSMNDKNMTREENEACNDVMYGYSTREKVHHDSIHIVNEMRRAGRGRGGLGKPKKAAAKKAGSPRKSKSAVTKILDKAERFLFGK